MPRRLLPLLLLPALLHASGWSPIPWHPSLRLASRAGAAIIPSPSSPSLLYVHGGLVNASAASPALLRLDLSTRSACLLTSNASQHAVARYQHAGAVAQGRVIIFGGLSPPATYHASLYSLDLNCSEIDYNCAGWRRVDVAAPGPAARAYMGYASRQGVLYIAGGVAALESGFGTRTMYADLWALDLNRMTWRLLCVLPSPRFSAAVGLYYPASPVQVVVAVLCGWRDGVDTGDGLQLASDAGMCVLDARSGNASWTALPVASGGCAGGTVTTPTEDAGLMMLTGSTTHAGMDSIAMRSVFTTATLPLVWNATQDVETATTSTGGAVLGWRSVTPASGPLASLLSPPVYACITAAWNGTVLCALGVPTPGWTGAAVNALTGLDMDAFAPAAAAAAASAVAPGVSYIVGALPSADVPVVLTRPPPGLTPSIGVILAVVVATLTFVLTLCTLGDAAVIACMRLRARAWACVPPRVRTCMRGSRFTAFMAPQQEDDMQAIEELIRQLEAATARAARVGGPTPEPVIAALPHVKFSVAVSALAPVSPTAPATGADAFTARARAAAREGVAGVDVAGSDCSVCLLEYTDGDALRLMPCGHFFHAACIERWLRTSSKLCPMCKHSVVAADASPAGASGATRGAHV